MRLLSIVAVLCVAALSSAEELKPLPERGPGFDRKAWTEYSLGLLNEQFPEHSETAASFRFDFLEWEAPIAATGKAGDHFVIYVSTGLLNIIANEHEYAVVLAHEFGHIILQHKINSPEFSELALRAKSRELWIRLTVEEMEADLFAAKNIADGYCASAAMLRRAAQSERVGVFHSRALWQVQQRIELLERLCAFLNKTEETEEK